MRHCHESENGMFLPWGGGESRRGGCPQAAGGGTKRARGRWGVIALLSRSNGRLASIAAHRRISTDNFYRQKYCGGLRLLIREIACRASVQ